MSNIFSIINASVLVQIREQWQMNQTDFAALLNVSARTYQGWEYGRSIPTQVQAHVRSIGNLRLIYQHWGKIAAAILRAGGTALTGEDIITAINDADQLSDDHERLWSELFPVLIRD